MAVIRFPGPTEPPSGPGDPEAVSILAADAARAIMLMARGATEWQQQMSERVERLERGHADWQIQYADRQNSMCRTISIIADEQTRQARAQVMWPRFAYGALAVAGGGLLAYALQVFVLLLSK